MRLKPKTVRRLLLGAGVIAVVISSTVCLVVVRKWQHRRQGDRLRAQGLTAYAEHRYTDAMNTLGPYLRGLTSYAGDGESLLAYARCREMVPLPRDAHLLEAVTVYETYLRGHPADRSASLHLLSLLMSTGQFNDAAEYAATLRPGDLAAATPEDLPVLRREAAALLTLRRFDTGFARVVDRWIELEPESLKAHLMYSAYLVASGQPAQAKARADRLLEEHPGDVRFRLLSLLSPGSHDRPLVDELCALAGLDPRSAARTGEANYPDEFYVERLVELFDTLGRHDHAAAVLADAATRIDDPQIRLASLRRAWQSGQPTEVNDRLAAMGEPDPDASAEWLGIRGLCLLTLDDPGAASAIASALRAKADMASSAWARAIESWMATPQRRSLPLESMRLARRDLPGSPEVAFLYGEMLAENGLSEQARVQWRSAAISPRAPGWSRPWIRISESLLADGRPDEALDAAVSALAASPGSLPALSAWVRAQAAQVMAGHPGAPDADTVLTRIESAVRQASAGDRSQRDPLLADLLPMRSVLLAAIGRRDEAIRAVTDAMVSYQSSRHILEGLAEASLRAGFGVEIECLDAAESMGGPTAHSSALRAAAYRNAGNPERGLTVLAAGASAANPADRVEWDMAAAKYLETIDPEQAAQRWLAVADAHNEDVLVQVLASRSAAVVARPSALSRVAQRLGSMRGPSADSPSEILRLVEADQVLQGAVTPSSRDRAVSILQGLVTESPRDMEPRERLISVLLLSDSANGVVPHTLDAVEQLRAAAAVAPAPAPYLLRAAVLLQRERDFEAARQELVAILSLPALDPGSRRHAVELLVQQGDWLTALPAMESMVGPDGEAPGELQLMLANAYAAIGREHDARAAYRRAAASPPRSPTQIVSLAAALYDRGDTDLAARLLSCLSSLDGISLARQRLAVGEFHAAVEEPIEAVAAAEAALALEPGLADAEHLIARSHAAMGDRQASLLAADRAISAGHPDASLSVFREQVRLTLGGDQATLALLADAMAASPAHAADVAAARALELLRVNGRSMETEALLQVARDNPASLFAQITVLERLISRPADAEAALRLGRTAMAAFPQDAEVARLTVTAARLAAEWNLMYTVAQQWRHRALGRSVEADAAAAQALLQLGRPSDALSLLQSRLDQSPRLASMSAGLELLSLAARAMVRVGDEARAFALLAPLLNAPGPIREATWPQLASREVRPPSRAAAWLSRLESSVPADLTDERLDVAAAWLALASRSQDIAIECINRAEAIIEPALKDDGLSAAYAHELWADCQRRRGRADASARSLARAADLYEAHISLSSDATRPRLLLAAVRERQGDRNAAIALYEGLLADPAVPVAFLPIIENNLAFALLAAGSSQQIDRARSLASRAALQTRSPWALDTLARAEAMAGRRNAAIDAYRAALSASPAFPSSLIGLADLLSTGSREERREATDLLARLPQDSPWQWQTPTPADLAEQLELVRARLRSDNH
ncbi:MAG: hypothetical protein KF745_01575 [Phycisphaeraceae bacterium]|nr:hypothetical protein [Phycisphaeraceae bacterium]